LLRSSPFLQHGFDAIDQRTLTEGGRLSTVNLLVLTSLNQQLLRLKNTIYDFTKQAVLLRRSVVLSLPLSLAFPALTFGAMIGFHLELFGMALRGVGGFADESENKMKMFFWREKFLKFVGLK
jgi:hypothetical protein